MNMIRPHVLCLFLIVSPFIAFSQIETSVQLTKSKAVLSFPSKYWAVEETEPYNSYKSYEFMLKKATLAKVYLT
jgi:hypothetical protein